MGRSEDLTTSNGKIRRLKHTQWEDQKTSKHTMGRSEDLKTPNGKIRRLKNTQWEDQKT
jgi:hypothetical protein